MKKKILSLCMVFTLAATAVVGGTLAYFTDATEEKENVFTVGNVNIELTENNWDENQEHNFMPGTKFEKDPTITLAEDSEDSWVFMKIRMNKFNSWLRLVAMQNDSDTQDLFNYESDCEKCKAAGREACQGHLDENGLMGFFDSGAYRVTFDEWFGGISHENWEVMNMDEVKATIKKSWETGSNITYVDFIVGYKTVLTEKQATTGALFSSVTMPASVTSKQLEDSRFNTEKEEWRLKITGYGIQAENIDTLQDAYTALFINNENADPEGTTTNKEATTA